MVKYSGKYKKTYIKDKAIIKFIKDHSKRASVDYSKIKIPSFLDLTQNKLEKVDCIYFDSEKIFTERKENKMLGPKFFPAFKFPKNNLTFLNSQKYIIESRINSTLFN